MSQKNRENAKKLIFYNSHLYTQCVPYLPSYKQLIASSVDWNTRNHIARFCQFVHEMWQNESVLVVVSGSI